MSRDPPSARDGEEAAAVTRLLQAAARGEAGAVDALMETVYGRLRRMAAGQLQSESRRETLRPTALVHEAYLRLLGERATPRFDNRAHFFGAAAEAMRRILVEHARAHASQRRGGGHRRVSFHDLAVEAEDQSLDLLALDAALADFQREEPELSRVALLRSFAGMSIAETAEALDVSVATVKRQWLYARAWLHEHIERGPAG